MPTAEVFELRPRFFYVGSSGEELMLGVSMRCRPFRLYVYPDRGIRSWDDWRMFLMSSPDITVWEHKDDPFSGLEMVEYLIRIGCYSIAGAPGRQRPPAEEL